MFIRVIKIELAETSDGFHIEPRYKVTYEAIVGNLTMYLELVHRKSGYVVKPLNEACKVLENYSEDLIVKQVVTSLTNSIQTGKIDQATIQDLALKINEQGEAFISIDHLPLRCQSCTGLIIKGQVYCPSCGAQIDYVRVTKFAELTYGDDKKV